MPIMKVRLIGSCADMPDNMMRAVSAYYMYLLYYLHTCVCTGMNSTGRGSLPDLCTRALLQNSPCNYFQGTEVSRRSHSRRGLHLRKISSDCEKLEVAAFCSGSSNGKGYHLKLLVQRDGPTVRHLPHCDRALFRQGFVFDTLQTLMQGLPVVPSCSLAYIVL